MELRWLEDFFALAEQRTFARAAAVRRMTQRAFGRRIRALEEWFGTRLFVRSASTRLSVLWCCVSMRKAKSRRLIAQPLLPMRPGQAERHTPDYKRHGTTSLFAALDVKVGTVIGKCMRRHRAQEVPQVPRLYRAQCSCRTRHPHRHGQRVEPQNQADP
jgi:hypothetical protein